MGTILEMWRIILESLPTTCLLLFPLANIYSGLVGAFQVLCCVSYMDYLFSIGNISLRWVLLSTPLWDKEADLEPLTSWSKGTEYK